jgi:hydrogenase/urease accessory protein HupE
LKGGPVRFALAVVFAAAPSLSHAHVGVGATTGFLTGLLHPLSGLDHIIAMVAVGLWGAQLGAPAIWMLPVTFPVVMAFGGLLGLIGVPLPSVEIGIALSGVLLGATVMTENRPPLCISITPESARSRSQSNRKCRLAAARRAQNGDQSTRGDVEIDAFQDRRSAEGF